MKKKNRNRTIWVWLWALVLLGGCSLTQDFGECAEDSECSEYGPYNHCASDGICERRSKELLLSDDCKRTYLDVESEDSVIIGLILPLSGPLKGLGDSVEQAIRLGIEDVNSIEGLGGSPVGLLICDSQGKPEAAQRAAEHLIDVVGVEAIIGPLTSTNVFNLGTQFAGNRQVLMITPSATSTALAALNDGGYVWRTTATDLHQGAALAQIMTGPMFTDAGLDPATVHVAVLQNTDEIYAEGLNSDFFGTLRAEGILNVDTNNNLTQISYTNDTVDTAVSQLKNLDPRPEVIVLFGLPEIWNILLDYDSHIEDTLGRTDTLYLLPDLGRDLQRAEQGKEHMIGRIWGTNLESRANNAANQSFETRFESAYLIDPDRQLFVSNAFDAVYALAVAAHGRPLKGSELIKGMQMLTGTVEIEATREGLLSAFSQVSQGQTIRLIGASGPLDFDSGTGDLLSKKSIVLWCYVLDGFDELGVVYDGTTFTSASCASLASGE